MYIIRRYFQVSSKICLMRGAAPAAGALRAQWCQGLT